MIRRDHTCPWDAQFTAEIEEIVLNFREAAPYRGRQGSDGQHHADGAVGLIDRAVRLDPEAVLGHSRAIPKTGAAVIAGTGIDLAQSMAHGNSSFVMVAG